MHTALHSLSNASRRISDVRVMRPSRPLSKSCVLFGLDTICLIQRPQRYASRAAHPNMCVPSPITSAEGMKNYKIPFAVMQICKASTFRVLATARTQIAAREIVLWTTPSEPPKALQASECSELLDPMRASCLILAQHQPGKFNDGRRCFKECSWLRNAKVLNHSLHLHNSASTAKN